MSVTNEIEAPIIDKIIRPITEQFFYSIAGDTPPTIGDYRAGDYSATDYKTTGA